MSPLERLILRNQHALMYALSTLKVGEEAQRVLHTQMVETIDHVTTKPPRKRKPPAVAEAWGPGSGSW